MSGLSKDTIEKKYKQALEMFIDKIKRDEQVIAVILAGSLSYDQVWEKSDIDINIIVNEQKLVRRQMCFVENEVLFNVSIFTRNDFKRWVEKSLQSSISHSFLVKSTLLFARDKSIEEYFDNIKYVGDRDRELQLLQLGCYALGGLAKAEKWYQVKKDITYSFFWVLKMVDTLAAIEVVLHREVPMREAVKQAMGFNPEFFHAIYIDLIHEKNDEIKLKNILRLINGYIAERADKLFQPVIKYLKDEGDVRPVSEIAERLGKVVNIMPGMLAEACDWLAEQGIIDKVSLMARATPKSRIQLEEPAFVLNDFDIFDDMDGEEKDEKVY